jgi:hypothetical protein
VTRRRFHTLRLIAWCAQLPLLLIESVRTSVPYLAFLSLAALIESSATDVDAARAAERERDDST